MKIKIKKNGFTLLELVVSMALIAFLSATMFQVIRVSDTQKGVTLEAEKIKAGIRLAQSSALSVPKDVTQNYVCGFGVHISSNSIRLYYLYNSDHRNNPDACDIGTLNYSPSSPLVKVEKEEIILGNGYNLNGQDIFFKAPYDSVLVGGAVLSSGNSSNFLISKGSALKTVRVFGSGKVVLE